MHASIHVRSALMADYEALCALWEELDEHHRRARPDLFRPPQGPRRERAWVAEVIEGSESDILVAEVGTGGLAGLALVRIEQPLDHPVRIPRPFVCLESVVVASAFRRRGVGARLVSACVRWARTRGIDQVELKMLEFNEGAHRFYEALGFVTVRRWLSLDARAGHADRARLGLGESAC